MEQHVCEGCGALAKMQCPKCISLKLPPAHFCSQECFQKSWPKHKAAHQPVDAIPKSDVQVQSRLNTLFASYRFTGPLRPGELSPWRIVPPEIKRPDYAETGRPESERIRRTNNAIEIKTPEQIEKMRTVCRLAREVLDIAGKAVRIGITTDEIDRIVHEATIARGGYPSPLNYCGFPKSCCTSVNEIICHGIPDSRPLEDGDIVNIDVTVYHDGVHGDVNDTFLVGNVDAAGQNLVRVAREALDQAILMVAPGRLYREVGGVISKIVHSAGLSVVRTYCGHGIGELFHTTPNVPHYSKNKAVGVMKVGHTFTIEPMINEGSWHDQLWPDDWTAATKDGRRSAQFEETILVTASGCEVLTRKRE